MIRLAAILLCVQQVCGAIVLLEDGFHVHPGDKIQEAVELAGKNKTNKVVKVHAGEYRPDSIRQAMVWFNKAHDGVRLEAVGEVTLTAANAQLAKPSEQGFPAVVNHIVYFGNGISSNTVLKGFRLTGANGFSTKEGTRQMEPDVTVPKNWFFFSDGGAIKVFGKSYPTLRDLEIVDNFTSPCGAGVSVQHQGFNQDSVLMENCVFRKNRAQATGAALDLLAGSAARILNCLFVGNVSNTGEDPVAKQSGERPFINSGAVTIFQNSRAEVIGCTFTGNRNGIDDMGGASSYVDCIFYDNNIDGGLKEAARYDLALPIGAKKVSGCRFNGTLHDREKAISAESNLLGAPDPKFDANFVPQAAEYKDAGYRPVSVVR